MLSKSSWKEHVTPRRTGLLDADSKIPAGGSLSKTCDSSGDFKKGIAIQGDGVKGKVRFIFLVGEGS